MNALLLKVFFPCYSRAYHLILMPFVWLYTLSSVALVSLISLAGVVVVSLGSRFVRDLIFFLVSLSVGALFGDVFIHLLPELFEGNPAPLQTSLFILLGVLIFFALEKVLHWHRHHSEEAAQEAAEEAAHGHVHPLGVLVLVSDGVHNVLDGIIIAASYLVGWEVGVATTLAVILHEIPQEIGDFGLLLHAGFSKARAFFFNFLSALAAFIGALAVLVLGGVSETLTSAIVAIAAGNFLYIAGSDLIPELHKTAELKKSLLQFLIVLIGIALMGLLLFLE